MSYSVDIQPAGINYLAPKESTILDAALINKIFLEHSCKKGDCGSCSANLLSGSVKNRDGEVLNSGEVLTCCSYAQSDISISANYFPELSEIQCVNLPCKVAFHKFVADDIIILKLRFPPNVQLNYLPGQYIDLSYKGVKRSFSIANSQSSSTGIELHIRLVPNGEFSQLLQDSSCVNQLMRLEGPKGTFFIRSKSGPIIFLAGGTGFAPVKAMVEDLISHNVQRDIYIYWGMAHSSYFYTDLPQIWGREFDSIHYTPVVSNNDDTWGGRSGLVHEAVIKDFLNLQDYQVYACGSPLMINAAKKSFIAQGLEPDHFYSDAFVASK